MEKFLTFGSELIAFSKGSFYVKVKVTLIKFLNCSVFAVNQNKEKIMQKVKHAVKFSREINSSILFQKLKEIVWGSPQMSLKSEWMKQVGIDSIFFVFPTNLRQF